MCGVCGAFCVHCHHIVFVVGDHVVVGTETRVQCIVFLPKRCIVVLSYTCVPFYYSLVSVRGMETFKIATPNNANGMEIPAIAVIRVPLETKNGTYYTEP